MRNYRVFPACLFIIRRGRLIGYKWLRCQKRRAAPGPVLRVIIVRTTRDDLVTLTTFVCRVYVLQALYGNKGEATSLYSCLQ